MIIVTIVHGNDSLEYNVFSSYETAIHIARDEEYRRHDDPNTFDSLAQVFTISDSQGRTVQVGTDDHYIIFEDSHDPHSPVAGFRPS